MTAEEATFRAFVVPKKRERYAELLQTKRGREKIRLSLDHFKDLDPTFCRRIESAKQFVPDILRTLKALGAPSVCHVISSNSSLDGLEMDLAEALGEIVGLGCGSFVCCVPGKLAYFEGEEMQERYICHRHRG